MVNTKDAVQLLAGYFFCTYEGERYAVNTSHTMVDITTIYPVVLSRGKKQKFLGSTECN